MRQRIVVLCIFVRMIETFTPLNEKEKKHSFLVRHSVLLPLFFVAFLWLLEGIQVWTRHRWVMLGILPREAEGLTGIITAPFVHAGYEHLGSNSLPLLVVGTGLIYFYREIAFRVTAMIWLFTGFWVWLAARPDAHIGASGLIYGFVVFLFFSGILRKDTRLMAISLLVTFLYGSMVWGILPVDQTVSWESHLAGSVAGLFAAVYYRREGPQRVKAQWEIEEETNGPEEIIYSEEVPPSPDDPPSSDIPPLHESNRPQDQIQIRYTYREGKADPPDPEK